MSEAGSPPHLDPTMSDAKKPSLILSILTLAKEWIPVLGGIAGLAALYGFVASFLLLPSRVDEAERQNVKQSADIQHVQQDNQQLSQRVASTEEINKVQGAEIVEIKNDAIQRREMLAVAVAMLTEVNERTKKMQDFLLNHPRP